MSGRAFNFLMNRRSRGDRPTKQKKMTFTVTYRGRDGALREEAVEAVDRAGCIAECRKRGISPTKIAEGSKGKGRDKRGPSRVGATGDSKRTTTRWVAVAVLLVIVVGGVWWWIGSRDTTAPVETPAKPKAVKPQQLPPRKSAVTPVATPVTNQPPPKVEEVPQETYLGRRVVNRQETTNEHGRVKVVLTTEDGLTHRYYITGEPRRVFHHSSDNALAALLNVPEGAEPAPYPIDPGLDDAFAKSLNEEIVDNDDDTEEERRLKDMVRQGRADALELMKTGVSFTQILREHQARAKENSEIRLKIAIEAKELAEKDGAEEANKYVRKMNEALERMGIPAVKEIKTQKGNQ